MSTFSNPFFNNSLRLLALVISLGFVWQAKAQPTIVSTVPPNGGSVSTNGPVVFTFSTGMDTNSTDAQFFDSAQIAANRAAYFVLRKQAVHLSW